MRGQAGNCICNAWSKMVLNIERTYLSHFVIVVRCYQGCENKVEFLCRVGTVDGKIATMCIDGAWGIDLIMGNDIFCFLFV